jgi:excisionase family DNA binding protein
LVSVHEAAERLGVSVNTVRRRVKSGEIPCTRIGKVLRLDLSKVRVLDQEEVEEMAQRAMARCRRRQTSPLRGAPESRTTLVGQSLRMAK